MNITVILFKRSIGAIALTESMICMMGPGRAMDLAMIIFLPDITLSTSGIIMPSDTPPNAEDAIIHRNAITSTPIWGITKPINRL